MLFGVGSSEGVVAAIELSTNQKTKTSELNTVCSATIHGMAVTSIVLVPAREADTSSTDNPAATANGSEPAAAAGADDSTESKSAGHPALLLSISLDQAIKTLPIVRSPKSFLSGSVVMGGVLPALAAAAYFAAGDSLGVATAVTGMIFNSTM